MKSHPFTIDAIVVLPDHLHCIWTLPVNDSNFSTRWRLIKGAFSRGISSKGEYISHSKLKRKERSVWQRRYWEPLVRDEDDLNAHINYIHNNPVKKGWVANIEDWPYSSIHKFLNAGYLSDG
jgi:putative transposase